MSLTSLVMIVVTNLRTDITLKMKEKLETPSNYLPYSQ